MVNQSEASLPSDNVLTGVWAELVGQQQAVRVLRRAVDGRHHAMTHAWLIGGPPGSGRSNAARAFAAALQCRFGGCGECNDCRTSLSGAHPDVTLMRTEQLSIGIDEVRDLVRKAAMSPTMGRYQVIVVEDADRITARGADALLKSIEEPPARTVWILCAPTPDDVIVTIRSRCRKVALRTPSSGDVMRLLIGRDHIDPQMAEFAAKAAQGHIGRARGLARDKKFRDARQAVLSVPQQLTSLGACLQVASELVAAADADTERMTSVLDAKDKARLEEALGVGTKGAKPRSTSAALKDLADQQKARAKRLRRDSLDSNLTELTTWYRDVLALQTGAIELLETQANQPVKGAGEIGNRDVGLINVALADEVARAAGAMKPEQTVRCIDAILDCRKALAANVAPLLAVEALLLKLFQEKSG